jgi:ABC-2 type transport system permease protein
MAVFRRGYERYNGPLTGGAARLLVMPRFAWARILSHRFVVVLLMASMFWPLVCIGFIYVSNHADTLLGGMGLGGGVTKMLKIDGKFFSVFMTVQVVFGMILAAVAGPGLIAPDLANNGLPLYFARPLSRWTYVLSRMIVLLGLLSLVTLIPGLLVFGMQVSMAGMSWFTSNWMLGQAIVLGFLLWMVTVSLVALTSSAYVKWRVVAGALVLAFFFVTAGAGTIINQVLRVQWGSLLNPGYAIGFIWSAMLGLDPPQDGPELYEFVLSLFVMLAILTAILMRKLRPVEVVS